MKRIIYIISCLIIISMILCCTVDNKKNVEVISTPEIMKDPVVEATMESTIEPTLEPTLEPTPEPTPEPIKYDELFDFSDWKEGLNEANNKEKYIEEYWKLKSNEVFYNIELYKLLKTDEQAKNAFLKEIRKQMTAQIINYLESSKIIITDEMKIYIDDMIDQQIKSLDEVIH